MGRFLDTVLPGTDLGVMIGKAGRGPAAVEAIARHGAAYLIAVGGAAFLVAQAIRAVRVAARARPRRGARHDGGGPRRPGGPSVHTLGPAARRIR